MDAVNRRYLAGAAAAILLIAAGGWVWVSSSAADTRPQQSQAFAFQVIAGSGDASIEGIRIADHRPDFPDEQGPYHVVLRDGAGDIVANMSFAVQTRTIRQPNGSGYTISERDIFLYAPYDADAETISVVYRGNEVAAVSLPNQICVPDRVCLPYCRGRNDPDC